MRQIFITLVCVFISTVVICYFIQHNPPIINNNTKIDSIKIQNDSIKEVIEHSTERIREIHEYYETEIKSIDTLPLDSNCVIFTKFVSKDTL